MQLFMPEISPFDLIVSSVLLPFRNWMERKYHVTSDSPSSHSG